LQRLAEAHLVRQNAVQAVLKERHEPLHAGKLVLAELAARDLRRLPLRVRLEHGLRLGLGLGNVCVALGALGKVLFRNVFRQVIAIILCGTRRRAGRRALAAGDSRRGRLLRT